MDNKEIISDWFEKYGNDIYHFLIYRIGPVDAEDLLQEVFIKALRGFNSYQEKSNPKTWLFSIARNVAVDEVRKRKVRKWMSHIPLENTNEPETTFSPQSILDHEEEHQTIYRAIKQLKSNYQDVIILRGIKELSIAETADVLKWSKSKVRSTQHRARLALHEALRRCNDNEETRS
ncbi:RNA polymerase sigma factor [Virgibacillus sp. L01]|uniref:RNA polymerase sigma factor n=1 Tax=Virgibacillus sp. L01 TaxID=3457429 RepID=UPI003FD0811C